MDIEGSRAHEEAYRAIAFELGAQLNAALKEKAELELVLKAVRTECDNLREQRTRLVGDLTAARETIADLRDFNERAIIIAAEECNSQKAELESQNKRLREALEKIAKWDRLAEQAKTGVTLMSQVGLIQAMAQAALNPER